MNFELGNRAFVTASKIFIAAVLAVIIALVQVAAFSQTAEAASNPVAKINSCDTAISTMNKTLLTIAKKRIAVRTAKKGGAKKVKRAKKNLKKAQKQGNQVRAAIKKYCAGGAGVSASDAACMLTINALAKDIELAYKRKLAIKQVKTKGAKAKKKKRKMNTQLKKLNDRVKSSSTNFQKACGAGSNNGGGNNNGNNNGGGNSGGGNNGGTPADTTAPGAVEITGPQTPSNDNTPTFEITPPAGETGGHIECKIDDGAYVTVTSPYTTPALTDGTHTITCRYVDAAGNAGPGTSVVITIDTTNPGTVTIDGPAGSTNDTTPTFTLSGAEPGDSYQCKVDDGSFETVTTPFTTATLTEGSHTITCHLVDSAGNVGDDTSVTIDVDTSNDENVVISGPTGPTSDNTPPIEITTPNGPGHLECKLNDGPFITVTSPFNLDVLNGGNPLADGTYTVTCHWVDGAGNVGPDTTFTVVIDTTAPGGVTVNGPSGSTNDNTPSYAISGGGEPVSYQCSVDGGPYVTVPAAYTTATLSDGSHTITCRAIDGAGNTGPGTSVTVDVDTAAPGAITVSGPSGLTSNTNPSYTLAGATGGDGYQCKTDGGSYAATTSPYSPSLGEGTHVVSCRAIDAAGNTGPVSSVNVTVDTVGPTTTIADGTVKWDGTHNFNLTSSEAGVTFKCSVDGGAYVTVGTSYTTGVLSNGSHSISCKSTDAAGNTGAVKTQSFGVFKDPAVVSKTGGFQWGIGCTLSSFLNAVLGCPDDSLSIAIPANPNGLTGNYLVDVSGYINNLSSTIGIGSKYTMYLTVDGASVASDSETVLFDFCGIFNADLSTSKTNLSLSSATPHTIKISLKTSSLISVFPSVSSSQLSVSIHH